VIARHLPVLIVVVPLISAPICVLLHDRRLVWGFATLVSWAAFATAIALVVRVMTGGTIHYHLGGWPPPWGIEYVIDPMSAFMLLIVSGIGAVTMSYAARSIPSEIPEKRIYLVYTMYLLCLTGLLGIVATGDAFNLFVFLEISSLSSYVLISLGRDRRALTASF
jgi:multicomponent Na+:H+ antiporter subunit D